MMECPECGYEATVYNGFADLENNRYIRRRRCQSCDYRFITIEVISDTPLQGNGMHGGARKPSNHATPEGGKSVFFNRKREDSPRPCEIDGDKAFFHRWVLNENAVTFALIEYIDGTVEKVNPERVRFTDR